jgi:hypothetical protein
MLKILFRGDFANVTFLAHQIINVTWFCFIGCVGRSVNFSFLDWCNNLLAKERDVDDSE